MIFTIHFLAKISKATQPHRPRHHEIVEFSRTLEAMCRASRWKTRREKSNIRFAVALIERFFIDPKTNQDMACTMKVKYMAWLECLE